jgi:hypothetical protein
MPERFQYRRGQPKPNDRSKFVTRASRWGNPHKIGECPRCKVVHDRDAAVAAFKADLFAGYWSPDGYHLITVDLVREQLAGYDLGCSCPVGETCHGDVLLEVIQGGRP